MPHAPASATGAAWTEELLEILPPSRRERLKPERLGVGITLLQRGASLQRSLLQHSHRDQGFRYGSATSVADRSQHQIVEIEAEVGCGRHRSHFRVVDASVGI